MKKVEKGLSVNILGKDYQLACEPEQEADLLQATEHLKTQLEKISQRGKVVGTERVAVLAAVNVCFELVQIHSQAAQQKSYEKRLSQLQSEVEGIVDQYRQISL